MPGRYTTKVRAKRIELDYFKRLHAFRRWKLILTLALPIVAAGALIVLAARGDQRIYNSGRVSTAHAMFDVQCNRCHVPSPAPAAQAQPAGPSFSLRVSAEACLRCHDGPVHHETQAFTPTCTACHVEHKGHVVLASMSDRHCTRCHADLQTKGPASGFARRIESFTNHPEFAVPVRDKDQILRVRLDDTKRLRDTAQVKLNHQKHLKPGLKGLDTLKAQRGMKGLVEGPTGLGITCSFCHQPDQQRAYMAPIDYAKHCGPGCHPLDFDAKLPDTVAPHDRPVIVHAFLRVAYSEAFERCQGIEAQKNGAAADLKKQCQQLELVKGEKGEKEEEEASRPRGRLGRREEAEEKPAPEQWVPTQLKLAESILFKQKCEFCHTLAYAPEKLPEVAATAIPARWLRHSRFDHGAHRPLGCAECHRAAQSAETTDVLLPSIATCRECHRAAGGARPGCVECHVYHDKARDRDFNGPLTVRDLAMGSPGSRPPASVGPAKTTGAR